MHLWGVLFDGSLQTHSGLISGTTNTHVIGCRIIGNRAILNGSSNGSYLIVGIDYVNHNHITAASSATNDGPYYTIGGSNGTYYTKNIFIDNLGYTNGFMIPQSNATVVNNTFYGSGAGRAIYVPGTYEHVMNICNNYIENWANGIGTNNGYTRPNNQQLQATASLTSQTRTMVSGTRITVSMILRTTPFSTTKH